MANQRYSNIVLENKFTDMLSTKLDLFNYVTIDRTLAMDAGMIKKVNVYGYTGNAQVLTEGNGNTVSIETALSSNPYTVKPHQARFVFTDEDLMTDPACVEAGLNGASTAVKNSIYAEAADEWLKTDNYIEGALNYNNFVDAIASLELEEDGEVFALCNPSAKAALRKACKEDMRYVESLAGAGYIGSIAGVPVHECKMLPNNTVIIATKEAVTAFIKRDTEVEQDRDPDTRTTKVIARMVAVVALTNAAKVAVIAPSKPVGDE